MKDIIQGTDKGLSIMNDILTEKKEEYYKKNGKELEITEEEFYDLMRKELSRQMRELGLLVGLIGLVIASKIAKPDDDEDQLAKNRYKWWAKATNKISDEIAFYYNPTSFESITKGSIMPSLGVVLKAEKFVDALSREAYGHASGDEKMVDKAYPTKYFMDMVPVMSQFQKEVLPFIDPELAKELGIRVTSEARQR